MTPSKISKAAQGTMEVIMRLALVICLPVSTQKQLFTFSNMVLCHPVLSLSPPPSLFISSSPSQPLSVSSSTFSPNHNRFLSLSLCLPRFSSHIFSILLTVFLSLFSLWPFLHPVLLSLPIFPPPASPTTHFSPSDLISLVTAFYLFSENISIE